MVIILLIFLNLIVIGLLFQDKLNWPLVKKVLFSFTLVCIALILLRFGNLYLPALLIGIAIIVPFLGNRRY